MFTEATQKQSRELLLGDSLSAFLEKVGIPKGGGRSNTAPRADGPASSHAHLSQLRYEDEARQKFHVNSQIADSGRSFGGASVSPDERTLWQSKIVLSHEVLQRDHPPPGAAGHEHPEGAHAQSRSALICMCGSTTGCSDLSEPLLLTWPQLYRQFGANPAKAGNKNTVNSFRTESLRELKKIKIAWPGLDYATPAGGLELRPSPLSVPSRQLRLLSR